MKAKIFIIIASICVLALTSCRDRFAEINLDQSKLTTTPSPIVYFTNPLYNLGNYQYTEWFYDNYQYMMPWTQVINKSTMNGSDFNQMGATGGREWSLYIEIWDNLFDIRREIDSYSSEKAETYQNIRAITYIPQVMQALKVTDIYGSIVYSEAMGGRYDGVYVMKYDTQEELYNQFLAELDAAIAVLATDHAVTQENLGKYDFVYLGDETKWIKLANTLKLRIATRLLSQNATLAKSVIQEVIDDETGPIISTGDEFRWTPGTEYGGMAHDLWGPPMATKNLTEFLKKNMDPRLRFWFERNDFTQEVVDHFIDAAAERPWFIPATITEPWDRYFGAPASPDSADVPAGQTHNDYIYDFKDPSNATSVLQVSRLNRKFMYPKYNSGTGYFVDVMAPASEACLYFAEFIQRGIVSSSTILGKTAQEWYEDGVTASVESMDYIAQKAEIDGYTTLKLGASEIATLLTTSDYAWGTNNLEKIYIQEYLNFFREPNELWVFARRTGFPTFTSTILAREHMKSSGTELVFPRRFPRLETDDTWNVENYHAALTQQGYTIGSTPALLNSERMWFDKNSPDYGHGTTTK
jgi:hypothetical protein